MSQSQRPPSPTDATRLESHSGGRANSINLQGRELLRLFEQFDASEAAGAKRRRDFVRWPFRQLAIAMRVRTGQGDVTIRVACRNLSRGGISVLHGAYMHPGTRCVVALPRVGRPPAVVEGVVARCTHRGGMVHEIGVRFAESVSVREFVRHDPLAEACSFEHVEPESLHGRLLHVEDSPFDVRLVAHFLRNSRVRLRQVTDALRALEVVHEGCDLILCDAHVPDLAGLQLVRDIRARGVTTPIILSTSDTGPGVREALIQARADAYLVKPITQDGLLRALAEFLMAVPDEESPPSSGDSPEAVAGLVGDFAQVLDQQVVRLQQARKQRDANACRAICLQIKCGAPAAGQTALARLAHDAADVLAQTGDPGAAATELDSLLEAAAHVRRAAA